jgi:ABC-type lipoprotein export system ATPase subunit
MNEINSWVVETKNLTRIYSNGSGTEIFALDKVNLKITAGELVTVMGPSGSGKSTLLNMIGALDKPTSGEVYINGQDLGKTRNKDKFRAQTVGFVFQLHNLLPTLTARENVEVPMQGYLGVRARRKRSAELLEMVGLDDRMRHLPGQLSGGQRQRVAVARALANNPTIILADEPTGSLDTTAGQDLMKLLRKLNEEHGTTFIVVTHDPAVARLTNRVVIMEDGTITHEDTIGTSLEEDLKAWRRSKLAHLILEDDPDTLEAIGLSKKQAQALHPLLDIPLDG